MLRTIGAFFLPLVAAGCSGVKCDQDGFLIVPEDAKFKVQEDAAMKNLALAGRRMRAGLFPRESGPGDLEKAEGCP